MRKTFLFGAALVAVLAAGIASSEAREVQIWGHTYTVGDDAPAAVAPARADKTDFKAQFEHPERMKHHRAQRIDMDLR